MLRGLLMNLCFILAWTALSPSQLPAGEPSDGWQAGAASVVITPKESMWMAGYAARKTPSEGKVQDLFAKALAVQDADGRRLVMVTLDLISVPRPMRDQLERDTAREYQLPPAGLMINCSHTHCGPELRTTEESLNEVESQRSNQAREYAQWLQNQLLELVGQALERIAPAKLSYCHARCGFAMNRRTPSESGFRNFPNPNGPVDHDVPVLRVEDSEGNLKAVLFGYACHNTTLGFNQFCGDYAGYAQQYLQEAHPETIALFVEGCGGDQNPYPRRTLELAQQHGRTLANAVQAALDTQPRAIEGRLRTAYATAKVEYQTPPTRAELLERAASQNIYDQRHAQRLLLQLQRDGKIRDQYDPPVQVIRFGDVLTMVALPGETVVDYSLRLKKELGGEKAKGPAVWVAGYSNDVFAYVPSRRVLLEGGYEAGGAMRYMTTVIQPGPFTETVEERIIGKVHELHEETDEATEGQRDKGTEAQRE